MKRNEFYILIISVLLYLNATAQSVSEVVAFADQQYEQGNYTIASQEYNRAIYFGYQHKDILALQVAHCYLQTNNIELASNFYDMAFRYSTNDSLKNEALLGNAFCYITQEKFILALSELYNVSANATQQQRCHYHFLKGIAHYSLQDDSVASEEFQQAILLNKMKESELITLQNEFEKVYWYHKRYRPQRAYVMSGIIPGSGQLYAGSVKDGLNSMVLIGGLYFIAMQVVKYYSFWDAAIALFPWVQRYYLGGMDKAKSLTTSKLEEKRYQSYERIIDLTIPYDF